MNDTQSLDAPAADNGANHSSTRAEIQLEREKVEIERERLALERERLAAEREKWREESLWKNRARGRLAVPVWFFLFLILFCGLLGAVVGIRFAQQGSFRRDDMARLIARAVQGSTNMQEQAQGKFLLKALSSQDSGSEGPYFVIID